MPGAVSTPVVRAGPCSIASAALISPLIRLIVKGVIRLLEGAAASMRAAARAAAEEGRKKDRRKLFALCAAALVILLAAVPLYRDRTAKREYAEEMEALRGAAVSDEVLWGRYETDTSAIGRERLEWIVIGREGEKVCLLTKYGIAGGYYHQKHTEVSWEDSDLRARLNSGEFTGMFSRYEMRHILEEDGDIVSLLPADRAAEVFATDEERIMSITAAAEKQGVNADRVSHDKVWFDRLYCSSWWWLRGEPGQEAVTAPIVEMDGSIRMAERAVNKPRGAVRPMVWVDTGPAQR